MTYAINPQVHASDDQSLIENLAAQGDTVASARQLCYGLNNGIPVHISPIALKPRFNVVATSGRRRGIPPSDPRQPTLWAAGWALGSLQSLGEAGVASITYFETSGERGICFSEGPSPVGRLLREILSFRPRTIHSIRTSHPLKISALLVHNGEVHRLFLANHTPDRREVYLTATDSAHFTTAPLSTANFALTFDRTHDSSAAGK